MDATAGSVQCSSPDRESGKESADDAGRRVRVSRLRVSEGSGADAVHVATREGVPQYSPPGSRSSAVVPIQRTSRYSDPEAEPGSEWVRWTPSFGQKIERP